MSTSKHKHRMSYREFQRKNKGKYSQKEFREAWKKYKNSGMDNTNSLNSIDGTNLINSTNSFNSINDTDSINSLNSIGSTDSINSLNSIGGTDSINSLNQLPMSPTRRRMPNPETPIVVDVTKVINITLDAPYAAKLLTKVPLIKLVQILVANPDLEQYLNDNVTFWANVYFLNYGRTQEYREMVFSGNKDPMIWKKMLMDQYRRMNPI